MGGPQSRGINAPSVGWDRDAGGVAGGDLGVFVVRYARLAVAKNFPAIRSGSAGLKRQHSFRHAVDHAQKRAGGTLR
jgi:hypothetical protein